MSTAMTTTATPDRQLSLAELVDRFAASMDVAAREYLTAATAYTAALDLYPDQAGAAFCERFPDFARTFWARLESVGRRQLDPRLIYGHYAAERYVRYLPYSQQKSCLDHGVEVLAADGSHLLVQVDRLTPQQCKMVFDGATLRDLPAQRAWLESSRMSTTPPRRRPPYEVSRRGLIVHDAITLTRADLLQILARMEGA
jgi:hypothetical protein